MSLRKVELDPELQNIAKEAKLADERNKQTAVSLQLTDSRQKMAAAREERKRLSGQFRNALTGLYDDEQVPTTDGEDMKNDEVLSWKDKVKQDPYVRKGTNIFGDMKRKRHCDYYKIALDASA